MKLLVDNVGYTLCLVAIHTQSNNSCIPYWIYGTSTL